jgi:Ran GTPase-activating protein (RanGAP) involved in mRNA processing and transport
MTQDRNTTLKEKIQRYDDRSIVDLRRQGLTDQDMEIVVQEAMINKQCKHLRLGSNRITSIGVSILADALKNNNTLQQLSLYDNDISDDSVYSLAKVLSIKNNKLNVLNLGNNRITNQGMKHLAQMIRTNRTLTDLYLQQNAISDEGVQILANAIENHNATIEYLSLESNKLLTDLSVDFLLQMIRNHRSLKRLYVFDCNLSETGKKRLIKAQQVKPNFKVYVNSFDD